MSTMAKKRDRSILKNEDIGNHDGKAFEKESRKDTDTGRNFVGV